MTNGYQYHVKLEHANQNQPNVNNAPNVPPPYMGTYPVPYQNYDKPIVEPEKTLTNSQTIPPNSLPLETNETEQPVKNQIEEEIDTKENIKLLPQHRKRVPKKKGKTSNYWNKKIEDKNFPFYGCTICNVSYSSIQELDEHVTIHEGRITSYDIRVRNKIKRKEKIKQLKKIKKLGKLLKKEKGVNKKEKDVNLDVEIKPEDGYIGNEKATEYTQNTDNTNQELPVKENTTDVNTDKSNIKDKGDKVIVNEPDDPRLLKLFKCFACQKQFSLSYYLRLHVRSHTDEKPYTCAECGQSFITASKLGRHNKRIHLAIRFQCRICYRFFSRFDILTKHFDKKHAADKIEGEPYDFNAILPYLKELEEQLKEQSETKPEQLKTENLWDDNTQSIKTIKEDDDTNVEERKIDVELSDTKVDMYGVDTKDNIVNEICSVTIGESDPMIKEDKHDFNMLVEDVKMEPFHDDHDDDHRDEDYRPESCSDDDYFPVNTWASTPVAEPLPVTSPERPSGKRGRARKGRGDKKSFPMQCELCEKTINSHSYYKIHLRTHNGDRPFKCYICGRGFITSSKMHRHVLTHPEYRDGEEEAKEENGDSVKEEGAENEEVKQENEEAGKTNKKRKSKKEKKAALKLPKDGKGYKKYRKRPHACIYCNKRFLHLDTLQVHKKTHEGEAVVLKCNFCLEEMADEEILKTHEATHEGPRPYLCTICNRTYTKKETMIYHRKSHSGGGAKSCEFICDICSKSFNAQCKLQRHLVSHNTEKFVLRYECPVCAHMFHTQYHVKMHLATHQKEGLILEENRNEILAMVLQNARKFPKKDDTSVNANIPALIPQDDERSRVCNICGQVFQHFYYLEEHLKSHGSLIAIEDENKAEENKHICPVCNKGFKLHYYLKLHSFTHSKERPFICQQCGKGFITKGKLKRHLETHTGLKKYQCHICYKFFTRPSYLRIHVRTIHGTQDYNFSNQFIGGSHPSEHSV
ncbi:zinc finger protein Xfin [Phthorimaea operculella]|nr:zinc finger protein Xfin [Phthorimaea operculella]